MNRLAEATRSVPFSNGTEGEAWTGKWCDYCANDHGLHGAVTSDPMCPIMGDAVCHDDDWRWPEAWLPEPDDGQGSLPSRMVCLAFKPCTKDDCQGDPGAGARAERIAEVTAYWQQVAIEGAQP